ncbi:hypothetical protein M378DRAFT_11147 [Amanita muscaria Koide BX008]|uniref:Uncharacterized protein n=1 Tax=Amanita muscaria (strain Koide BX008) TaxID=946122 RepID=A0A0C2TE24_AMAMK|nr:hypothetical protein M378DRAFT_11147 [Amanita muscaria Koide BX008]
MDAAGSFAFQILVRAPSMAANIVDPPFLHLLSSQQTIGQLDNFITTSALFAATNPQEAVEDPTYHDPSRYHVRQIDIIKRCYQFIQHEGIILTIRRQGLPPGLADDFYLLINRDVKSGAFIRAIFTCFLSRKLAIDRVGYILPNSATRPPFDSALWTMRIDQDGLTLMHITKLLYAISGSIPGDNQYYHLFNRNCYWYTRVFNRLITRIAPQAAGASGWQIQDHENRNHFWYRLGRCFGIQADGSEPPEADEAEINGLETRYNHCYNQLMERVTWVRQALAQAQVQAQDEI